MKTLIQLFKKRKSYQYQLHDGRYLDLSAQALENNLKDLLMLLAIVATLTVFFVGFTFLKA